MSRPAGEVWVVTMSEICGGGELILLTVGPTAERSWRTRCAVLHNTTEDELNPGEEGDYPINEVSWVRVL